MAESGAEESVLANSKIQIISIDNNSEFCVVTIRGRGFTGGVWDDVCRVQ